MTTWIFTATAASFFSRRPRYRIVEGLPLDRYHCPVSEALFVRHGDSFVPTELSRSPWTPQALHAGPPAALVARALEALDGDRWWVVRVSVDIMGEIPVVPLRVETGLERSGRRVQLVEARVAGPGGDPLIRAFAWRVRRCDPLPLPPAADPRPPLPPLPETLAPFEQTFRDYVDFFGHAVDKRLVSGRVMEPGRATMWFRLRVPVVAGEAPTPLQALLAVVDSANGISWALPFDRFVFPNTDLGVYLAREPAGEWIALDAVSYLDPGGRGISDTAVFDTSGFVGRANQALFVGERGPQEADPGPVPGVPGHRRGDSPAGV
jgi:hypothetical protein